jgi:hypothetical protein
LRDVDRTQIVLDHEELLQPVPIDIQFLAGVRLANASRSIDAGGAANTKVLLRILGRDGSRIDGELTEVKLGVWSLHPLWNPSSVLKISFDEIVMAQVMNGRVQYLSQWDPIKVQEQTVSTPPQPYRRDKSCQGDRLSIGTQTFLWGLGVHANSSLTYKIGGKFKTFHATIGIASGMETRGSVIFKLIGDGKELFASPLLRGSSPPMDVAVPIEGVDELTLQVNDGGDLDLGDAANWGAVRVVR